MEVFADTADIAEITKWLRRGVLDGVTTNPSIMLKDGVRDMEKAAREIAEVLEGRPVSVEVTSNDPDEMLGQAQAYATWAPNIVVKIPIINEDGAPCLEVIRALAADGIKVNATAMLSFNQVMLAAKAGAAYLSIFAGRVADEGHDAFVARLLRQHFIIRERAAHPDDVLLQIEGSRGRSPVERSVSLNSATSSWKCRSAAASL